MTSYLHSSPLLSSNFIEPLRPNAYVMCKGFFYAVSQLSHAPFSRLLISYTYMTYSLWFGQSGSMKKSLKKAEGWRGGNARYLGNPGSP